MEELPQTSEFLATLEFELDALANYLFESDKDYEGFKELSKSNEEAMKVLNARASGKDKIRAINGVTSYMRFLATRHLQKLDREVTYFTHVQTYTRLKQLSAHIVKAVKILEEDYAALEKVVY